MKTDNTLRNILIGLTIIFSKIPLFAAAYLLNETDYNSFNKFYYSASVIVIFSSFGFDFAINYSKSKIWVTAATILVNVLLTSCMILLVSPADWNNGEYLYLIVFAFLLTLTGILVFRVLFTGKYLEYFYLQLVSTVLTLAVIIIYGKIGGEAIHYLLPISAFLAFALVYIIYRKTEKEVLTSSNFMMLYRFGAAAFIINGIVPLLLAADKYIVNQHFDLTTANSYTFAWALAAPMFYIGNTSEKVIYSGNNKANTNTFTKTFWFNTIAIFAYMCGLFILINYLEGLLPKSLQVSSLKEIVYFMLPGYAVYAVLHFPVNGYLFKYQKTDKQKKIAAKFLLVGVAAVILFILMKEAVYTNYRYLITFNFIILLTLLIVKITAIWDLKNLQNISKSFLKREQDELS